MGINFGQIKRVRLFWRDGDLKGARRANAVRVERCDGGDSFDYYGGVLLQVAHDRWAGLSIGITARPDTCGTQVLRTHAVLAAADQILRTATLDRPSVTSG